MAPRKTKTEAPGTALTTWDEELAAAAQLAADMEANAAGGSFFSLKGGILAFNGNAFPDNEVYAILLDSIFENVYYEGDYDDADPQPPMCFAHSRVEKNLAPHKVVFEAGNAQHDVCFGCDQNEWGSAEKGRGKACKNRRRLALLGAGTNNNGKFELFPADYLGTAAVGFLPLPVTSVKGYAAYVQRCAALVKRPPWALVTKVKVIPDAATQLKVTFAEALLLPNDVLGVVKGRVEEVKALIEFPYAPRDSDKPAKNRAKTPAKAAARGRR